MCNKKDEYTVLGGDMNCILEKKIDQRNSIHRFDNSALVLKNRMIKHKLTDIWRQYHKNKTQNYL